MSSGTENVATSVEPTSNAQGNKLPLLVGISLGYFMVLLDTTIVTVALPKIQESLHGTLSELQWVSNAYTLTFAALLLTAGALSDKFGGKQVFTIGLWAFAILSGISTLASTINVLIVMRALLGIAGALLLPTSLAIIANTYTDPAARAKALGGWAAITGIALAMGPVIGGILTDTVGWRAIFLINVPVAILSIGLTLTFARETSRLPGRGIDLMGQAFSIIALASLTYGLIEGAPLGWSNRYVTGAFGLAAIAIVVFICLQNGKAAKGAACMLPLRLFRIPTFSAGLFAGLLVNFGLTGLLFVFSLFFQVGRQYTALEAGLAFLPLTLPTAFNPIFTGRLVAKVGPRGPAVLGFLLMAAGAFAQIPFTTTNTATALVANCVGLAVFGFGVSFAIPSLITAIVMNVPKELTGIGSGSLNSARQTGALLGVAILGSLTGLDQGTAVGTQHALAIIGSALVLGAIVVGFVVERKGN